MSVFDRVFTQASGVASKLGLTAASKILLVTIRGRLISEPPDPPQYEGSADQPLYGAIGVVSRPRPPSATGAVQYMCARTEDGLAPIASLDRRISTARGDVGEGYITLAGYAGGHVTIQDLPSDAGSSLLLHAQNKLGTIVVDVAHNAATGVWTATATKAGVSATLTIDPAGTVAASKTGAAGALGVMLAPTGTTIAAIIAALATASTQLVTLGQAGLGAPPTLPSAATSTVLKAAP